MAGKFTTIRVTPEVRDAVNSLAGGATADDAIRRLLALVPTEALSPWQREELSKVLPEMSDSQGGS